VAPLIAVPTTSGTGSEVARGAIIIVDDHRKLGFHSWNLVPKAAICDPELTLGLPPADGRHRHGRHRPLHGNLHVGGLQPARRRHRAGWPERGWSSIARATRTAGRREARLNMMSASMQGAMAFQKGLGACTLSHSLGGVNPRLHHGTLNAMFLPAVVRFNAQAASVQKTGAWNAWPTPWASATTSRMRFAT
jgi:alcohol dehydrogenase class IV